MKLTEPLKKCCGIYRLNLSYNRILQVFNIFDDSTLSDMDKINLAIRLTVKWPRPLLITAKIKLWNKIYEDFIKPRDIDSDSNDIVFDFEQDADYIYAAFRQAYGINLIEQREKLDWREFFALFQSLPDDTHFSEIIDIRSRPIPAPDEYNHDEIEALRKAKRAYALKVKHKPGEKWDSKLKPQLDSLFAYYKNKAGG